jgi:hypothetical protein
VYFAAGGAGGQQTGANASGGTGGGGASNTAGVDGTGGGGGGNQMGSGSSGKGGNGVVIISYPDTYPAAASAPNATVTVAGGVRIYSWTTSGSITF